MDRSLDERSADGAHEALESAERFRTETPGFESVPEGCVAAPTEELHQSAQFRLKAHAPPAAQLRQVKERPVVLDPFFDHKAERDGNARFALKAKVRGAALGDLAERSQEGELVGCGLLIGEDHRLQVLSGRPRGGVPDKHHGVPGDVPSKAVSGLTVLGAGKAEVLHEQPHALCGPALIAPRIILRVARTEGQDHEPFIRDQPVNRLCRGKEFCVREMHDHCDGDDGVKGRTRVRAGHDAGFAKILFSGRHGKLAECHAPGACSSFAQHLRTCVRGNDIGSQARHEPGVPARAASEFEHVHAALDPAIEDRVDLVAASGFILVAQGARVALVPENGVSVSHDGNLPAPRLFRGTEPEDPAAPSERQPPGQDCRRNAWGRARGFRASRWS